jgi:hypothetical protein
LLDVLFVEVGEFVDYLSCCQAIGDEAVTIFPT